MRPWIGRRQEFGIHSVKPNIILETFFIYDFLKITIFFIIFCDPSLSLFY